MPGNGKYDDDDYVAKLLAEDAKKSSQRYAAVGLSALLPKRPTNGAPKPNTRFLSHLVREADNHNAALKKKEELEARIRLREMSRQEKRGREDGRERDRDGHDRKRRRAEDKDDGRLRYREPERSRDGRRSVSPHSEKKYRDDKSRRSHRHERDGKEYRSEDRKSTSHRDGDTARDERRRHHHSQRAQSLTPERSPSHRNKPHHSHRPSRRRSRSPAPVNNNEDSEGDLLSDLIGPKPVPSSRGRGSRTIRNNIDAHFSSAYDPNLDVHPDSDGDEASRQEEQEDWDMALEALRDRTMWKKKQSERLRDAGFGEEEIRKWEVTARGGGGGDDDRGDIRNGDVTDVRWKKKGEARERDAGKEEVT